MPLLPATPTVWPRTPSMSFNRALRSPCLDFSPMVPSNFKSRALPGRLTSSRPPPTCPTGSPLAPTCPLRHPSRLPIRTPPTSHVAFIVPPCSHEEEANRRLQLVGHASGL